MRVRPPEWRPEGALADATWKALDWWYERNPRKQRPAGAGFDAEFLAYAWTLRELSPLQIEILAANVLKRSNGNMPDHAEIEAELADLRAEAERRRRLKADASKPKARWSGEELEPCPTCHADPRYTIFDREWLFGLDCACSGWPAGSQLKSLWLRGRHANPDDDPRALAQLNRASAETTVTAWRASGRKLADVLRDRQVVA